MKLAITKTDFPFGVKVLPIEDGFNVKWISAADDDKPGVDFTAAYIQQRCGSREITDATNIYIEIDFAGEVTCVHNKMVSTLLEKSNGYEYALKNSILIAAQIYIPFADSPVADWVLRVNGNPAIAVEVPENTVEIAHSFQAFHDFAEALYPNIQLIEIKNAVAECFDVMVQILYHDKPLAKEGVRLFVRAETGYINKREVHTDVQGRAMIRARRLDLNAGDPMRVEFGFKFTRNLLYVDIPQP